MRRNRWAALALACLLPLVAQAQKSAADGIAEYRKMLEDGNPAELFEMKGEELWKQARGPKKATLERCDLGLGPGVVKGAWVQLPRYFADTGRVQDVESRLVSCMATLQGFNEAELGKTPFGRGEMANITALATWIASQSRGQRFALPQGHVEEKRFYELGKRAFFFRGGPMDFSCASCHGEDGKGETKQANETKEKAYHIREQRWGAFERSIVLPTEVVADKAKADFENGVLTITLPKAEEVKPKSISIKTK